MDLAELDRTLTYLKDRCVIEDLHTTHRQIRIENGGYLLEVSHAGRTVIASSLEEVERWISDMERVG